MYQDQPILTNEETLALMDICNELCVAINTYQICCHPNNQGHSSWDHLIARKNDARNFLNKPKFINQKHSY